MKELVKKIWFIENQIRLYISFSKFIALKIPYLGRPLSMIFDRLLLAVYGIDLISESINIRSLSISHPSGVLLGGNGIYSDGRVVIMAGVKFGARTPSDPVYLDLHKQKKVFQLGDNVVIGSNTVILGPVEICDNVIIGSMSLVNKPITEPGTYVGIPVKKISDHTDPSWVSHLP